MRKIFILSLILALIGGVVFAEGTDKAKKDEMDDDLDELNQELKPESVSEEVNVMEVLKQIEEKMTDAADGLSKSSLWKSIKEGERAELSLDEIIKKQKEAIEQLNKSFQNTKSQQKVAIDEITRLIKLARKMQSQSQSQSQQQQQQQSAQQPQQKKETGQQQTGRKPAKEPYDAKTVPSGVGRHYAGASDRWGNLPPKLRDAITLSKNEEFTLEYHEWLQRYFKILAGEEK